LPDVLALATDGTADVRTFALEIRRRELDPALPALLLGLAVLPELSTRGRVRMFDVALTVGAVHDWGSLMRASTSRAQTSRAWALPSA
jgi:hypothetical protein